MQRIGALRTIQQQSLWGAPGDGWTDHVPRRLRELLERPDQVRPLEHPNLKRPGCPLRIAVSDLDQGGGDHNRITLDDLPEQFDDDQVDLLALDEALQKLEAEQPRNAQLIKLRYFAGCTLEETAQILGISRATAQRNWAYARAWLYGRLSDR